MAQPGTRQDFAGTTRFQLRRKIGEGGMGVVWEAVDKERLTNVALKTLRTLAPDALLRFKHEFRALQDVSHPNLVSLGELVEEGGQWFFTMELVRGVPLLKWVRPHDDFGAAEVTTTGPSPPRAGSPAPTPLGTFDEVRMRAAFAQLAEAVAALHARGLVHRDVKPSNVLVTEAGRVVLLDFGVVAEAAAHGDGVVVGTAAYMAPEQASGAPVSAAADWYAFGAVLHQALTGRIPNAPNASPRAFAPELPVDLDVLCRALTAADPAARPTDAEVLALLGVSAPSAVPHAAGFVGRAGELAALHEAFAAARAQTTALVVYGESGVGKSALVRRFIDELRAGAPDALVLAARCYERESVHYKAVDGAIDALARWLSSLWPDELERLLPSELALAAELFPVLLRVDAIADLERAPALAAAPEDPHELRNRAFAALRALFAAVGATRPLVLALDDLQWADADSLALIAELVRAPDAPRLLLVLTMRATDEAAPRELVRRLGGEVRLVPVPPLAFAEARQLAAELLGRADGYSRGRGGSMHVAIPEIGLLGTNGIVGGGIPIGTGAALGL
ncbi:MAG TPA: AAA family ATPase, partial [Polyangia bacterium]